MDVIWLAQSIYTQLVVAAGPSPSREHLANLRDEAFNAADVFGESERCKVKEAEAMADMEAGRLRWDELHDAPPADEPSKPVAEEAKLTSEVSTEEALGLTLPPVPEEPKPQEHNSPKWSKKRK